MVRPHYGNRTTGKNSSGKLILRRDVDGRLRTAKQLGHKPVPERRQAKWDDGVAELEAKMEQARGHKHRFKPMGKLDSCERCGMPGGFSAHRE